MPFEEMRTSQMRIAVVGGGISGMGAAHMLADEHIVTLYEAEPRLGGHARTIMAGKTGNQPVDTGFLVFNKANYPNLVKLFDDLQVPIAKSNMSFGASIAGGKMEYGLASLGALFATRSNLTNPSFWRMIRDITKFNRAGLKTARANPNQTIADFLETLGTGNWFRDYYLLPLSGAIWSTPTEKIMDFPAYAMMQFFENHALLSATGQHQWYTVDGGSVEYVRRLETSMRAKGVEIRCNAGIEAVTRKAGQVQVKSQGANWETFDAIVMATHSDDTLRLLTDASAEERGVLGAIAYQPNDIVLHRDVSIMPKRKNVWSSWVYTEDKDNPSDRIDLTYWINSLQPIPEDDPHFVTLNTRRAIRDDLIYDQTTLRHPVYDLAALDAQQKAKAMNGQQNTWFCGAWMRHGFHEDGLASAVDVVKAFAQRPSVSIAAE